MNTALKGKKNDFKKKAKEWLYITFGVMLIAFSFTVFLNPNNLVIGGVSGLGIIIKALTSGWDPALIILIVNLVLLIIGLLLLGKDFLLKTAYGSLTFPLFIFIFEIIYKSSGVFELLNNLDMIIIIIFSSSLMGIGCGMVLKLGGTTGGTEVIQKILFKYFHIPFSYSLYALDGVVIILGIVFGVQTLNTALYVLVFAFISGAVIDLVVFSGFNKRAVYIISNKIEEIKQVVLDDLERGLSSIKVVGEYSKQERTMLVCILSTTEYLRLRSIIESIDPTAFYFVVRANEVRGEGFSYE